MVNCKKGDIARTVNFGGGISHLNNKIVRCVEYELVGSLDGWVIDRPIRITATDTFHTADRRTIRSGETVDVRWIGDAYLIPLDNPGDDEVDEISRMKDWELTQ